LYVRGKETDSVFWKSAEHLTSETALYKPVSRGKRTVYPWSSPHGESSYGDRAIVERYSKRLADSEAVYPQAFYPWGLVPRR